MSYIDVLVGLKGQRAVCCSYIVDINSYYINEAIIYGLFCNVLYDCFKKVFCHINCCPNC